MKHTDFFSIIKRIKVRELKEIVAALRLHGGAYEWTDVCDSPMIAADTGGGLMDAAVLRAVLGKDGLQLECADTSNGECMTIMPHDVFAGHLSYITDKVPPINGTGDVTAPKEYFAIAWIGREDIAAKGYDMMERIARRMGDAYSDNGYGEDLDMAATEAGLARIKARTLFGI